MTEAQKNRVTSLSQSYPKTGRAFRIVQALDEFYAADSRDEGE